MYYSCITSPNHPLCVGGGRRSHSNQHRPTSSSAGVENVRQKSNKLAEEEKTLLIISFLKMEPCLGIECKICCHSFSSEQEHGCAVFNETAASWKISQNWKGDHFHGFALFCIGLNFIALHYLEVRALRTTLDNFAFHCVTPSNCTA